MLSLEGLARTDQVSRAFGGVAGLDSDPLVLSLCLDLLVSTSVLSRRSTLRKDKRGTCILPFAITELVRRHYQGTSSTIPIIDYIVSLGGAPRLVSPTCCRVAHVCPAKGFDDEYNTPARDN